MGKYLKEAKKIQNDFCEGLYINSNGLRRVKSTSKEDVLIPVSRYDLEYCILINNGVEDNQIAVKFKGKNEVSGLITAMPHILEKKGLMGEKDSEAKKFISSMVNSPSTKLEKRVEGGYSDLKQIKKPKFEKNDLKYIQKYIINYIGDYFTPEMITALKLLLLFPFHWIMKNDVDIVKKKLIKGVSLFGKPDVAKTLIILYVMNLFIKDELSLDADAKPYDSIAGFRGALCKNLGITIVDEFNNLLLNKEIRPRLNDIINTIYTKTLSVQGVTGGGDITSDAYTATPAFTSNVKPTWNNSNLKRLDVIKMDEVFNPTVKISISKGKRIMLLLGDIIAYTFKEHYKEIVSCRDSLEASETLLSKIDGLDLTTIINCPDCRTTNLKNMPLNILVKKDLDKRNGKEINLWDNIQYGNFNLPWLIKQTPTKLAIEPDIFYDYLMGLIGDPSVNIREYLDGELKIASKTIAIGKKRDWIPCIELTDFETWLGLNEIDDEPVIKEHVIIESSWDNIDPKFRLGEHYSSI